LGQAIGGQTGNVAKDDRENEGIEDGLDDEPERAEDGLLVAGDEVSAHEEGDQVAVVPDVAQLQVVPFFAGGDDEVPGVVIGHKFLVSMRRS